MTYINKNSEPLDQQPRHLTISINNTNFITCSIGITVINTLDVPMVSIPAGYFIDYTEDEGAIPVTNTTFQITDEDNNYLYKAKIYIANTPTQYGVNDFLYILPHPDFVIVGNGTNSITATSESLITTHSVFQELLKNVSFETDDQSTDITRNLTITVEEFPLGETGPSAPVIIPIIINQLNDRPVFKVPLRTNVTLDNYLPLISNNPGFYPSFLANSSVVSDPDSNYPPNPDFIGLIIYNISIDSSLVGNWQYWSNGTWINISTVDICDPVFITPAQRIRFLPGPNFYQLSGKASFKYHIWDGTSTNICTNNTLRTDQQSPVSANSDTFTYSVTYLNRPPVINVVGGYNLTAILEDMPTQGENVYNISVAIGSDPDDMVLSLVVISADQTNGIWQYDNNTEVSFVDFPTNLSTTNALHLFPESYIRFLPHPHFVGQTHIVVYLWDMNNFVNINNSPYLLSLPLPLSNSSSYSLSNITLSLSVLHVNDPPNITLSQTSLTFKENGPQIQLFPQLNIIDVDNTLLQSATVTLTCPLCPIDINSSANNSGSGLTPGSTDQIVTRHTSNTFSVTFTETGPVIILEITSVGGATIPEFISYLTSLYFDNIMEEPVLSNRIVSLSVSDGVDSSNIVTVTVAMQQDNDNPPTLNLPYTTIDYTEGNGVIDLFTNSQLAAVSDIDETLDLYSLHVTLSGTSTEGITTIYNSSDLTLSINTTHSIVFTGPAPIDTFNQALNSIQYYNTADEPGIATSRVSFAINDSYYLTTSDLTIQSVPVNDHLPVLYLNTTSVTFTEVNLVSAPVYIATDITVTDPDIPVTPVGNATLTIINPQDGDQEYLDLHGHIPDIGAIQNGHSLYIRSVSNNGLSPIVLQDALQSVRYHNEAEEPSPVSRNVSIVVFDNIIGSYQQYTDPLYISVDIVLTNDDPVVNLYSDIAYYTEGHSHITVSPNATITDVDNSDLSGLVIELDTSTLADATYERLYINQTLLLHLPIAANITNTSIYLTGDVSIDIYQSILQSLAYSNVDTSGNPDTSSRRITVTPIGAGGSGLGVSDDVIINFSAVNNPPILDLNGLAQPGLNLSVYFVEESNSPVHLLSEDFILIDPDNTALHSVNITLFPYMDVGQEQLQIMPHDNVTITQHLPDHISLTGTPLADINDFKLTLSTLTYINTADEPRPGSRWVEFIVHDGEATSAPVITTIIISYVNDRPYLNLTSVSRDFNTKWIEGSLPTSISDDPSISDVDNTTFTALRVTDLTQKDSDIINSTEVDLIRDSNTYMVSFDPPVNTSDLIDVISSLTYYNSLNEPPVGTRNYSLTIYDGISWSDPSFVLIDFIPVNDNPPVFNRTLYTTYIVEEISNINIGVSFNVTDADSFNSPINYTWAITAGDDCHQTSSGTMSQAFFSGDSSSSGELYTPEVPPCRFHINSTSGVISTSTTPPDREAKSLYILTVNVSDGAFSSTAEVQVTIYDVNDNPTCFSPREYNVSVPFGASAGHVLAHLMLVDPDTTSGFILYSIKPVLMSDTIQSALRINSTGYLILTVSETDPSFITNIPVHTIEVTVDDGLRSSDEFGCNAVINISVPINAHAPQFNQTLYTFDVIENTPALTEVYTVTANDNDDGSNAQLTYSLEPNGAPFSIDSTSGVITITLSPDYEQFNEYHFTVTARDSGKLSRSTTANVTVYITGVNEFTPILDVLQYNIYICENTNIDTSIAQILASDDDSGTDGIIEYTLTNLSGCVNCYTIDSTSGIVYVSGAIDFENNNTMNTVFNVSISNINGAMPSSVTGSLQIHVLNSNEYAPVFTSNQVSVYIPENYPVSTALPKQIMATDNDSCSIDQCTSTNITDNSTCTQPADLIYNLTSGNTENLFSIDPQTGIISLITSIDRDVLDQFNFELNISVTDGQYITYASLYVVVVNISRFSPVFDQEKYTVSVNESAPVNTVILTVRASDVDNNPFTYSMSGDNSDHFSIDPQTGYISIARPLDYELIQQYTLLINATELANTSISGFTVVVINITDINDNAPSFSPNHYSFNIAENSPAGTLVGTVYATDRDAGSNALFDYILLQTTPFNTTSIDITTTNDYFYINLTTGDIYSLTSLDRETIPRYTLQVAAIDRGNLSTNATVTIDITDVNDNTPVFTNMAPVAINVSESAGIGTVVYQLVAMDGDIGLNSLVKYSILEGNDDGHFMLNPDTGVLSVNSTLDFETQRLYNLTVQAVDRGMPAMTSQPLSVQLNIIDINDNAPVINSSLVAAIFENSLNNTSVLTLSASDADTGSNAVVNFAILGPHGTPFYINPGTNEIRVLDSTKLDRETQDNFTLEIVAFNPLHIDGPNTTASLVIILLDVNDNSPTFTNDTIALYINEDVYIDGILNSTYDPIGRYIATVTATDADTPPNSNLTYNIINDTGSFAIDQHTGAIYAIEILDYELQTTYSLVISANDNGHPTSRTGYVTVIINLIDLNDNAPVFANETYTVSISEAAGIGSHIVRVSATDEDSGTNMVITYSLENVSSTFSINSATGDIVLIQSLDRESISQYTLNVIATDGGVAPLSSTSIINVTVLDVNDNAPVIRPLSINSTLLENTQVGVVVATFEVTDADIGINADTVLSLDGQSDHFAVNQEGVVTLSSALDYETGPTTLNISLVARNTHLPHFVSRYSFIIDIINENDNAPIIVFDRTDLTFHEGSSYEQLDVGINIEDPDGRNFTQIHDAKVEFIRPNPLEPSYPFTPTAADNPSDCPLEVKKNKIKACLVDNSPDSILPDNEVKLTLFPNSIISERRTTLILNGQSQFAMINSMDSIYTNFSMLTWIWYTYSSTPSTIFTYISTSDSHTVYSALCTGNDLQFIYYFNETEQTVTINGGCNGLQSQWHHLAITTNSLYGTPLLTIYIDGIVYFNTSIYQPVDTSNKRLYIGGRSSDGVNFQDFFAGRIHRLLFTSYPVTDNNINCIIGCGVYLYSSVQSPPVSYFYNYTGRFFYANGIRDIPLYESFLNTLIFVIAFEEPRNLQYNVDYTVTDGGFNCIPIRLNITLIPTNDGEPILSLNGNISTGFAAVFIEESGPVSIVNSTSLNLTDTDLVPFPYTVNVTILDSLQPTNEELLQVFNLPNGMTQYYINHSLIISGMFEITEFQTALRTLTYNNIADEPVGAGRNISFIVLDPPRTSATVYSIIKFIYINDKPTLSIVSTAIEYSEGDGVVPLLLSVELSDNDNVTMVSARVEFSAPDGTLETLYVNTTGTNVTSSYHPLTNVLALDGEDTIDSYRQVLMSLSYENTKTGNITGGTRSIVITVSDGIATSNSVTSRVFIKGINDMPVIDLNGDAPGDDFLINFYEDLNTTIPAVSPNLTIIDIDNLNLEYVEITFLSRPDAQLELVTVATEGTPLSFDSLNDTYYIRPLSGSSAPIGQFQSVLRSLRYRSDAEEPTPGDRSLRILAFDGADISNIVYSNITVISTNDIPYIDLDTTANGTGYTATYIEETATPTRVTSDNVLVADNDVDAVVETVVVTIEGAVDGMYEKLVSLDSNVTLPPASLMNDKLRYNIVLINGTLSYVEYLLTTLAYINTLSEPTPAIRYINFSIFDGIDFSNTAISMVTVETVNDHTPTFAQPTFAGSVTENEAAGTVVVTVVATDSDSGDNGIITYSIIEATPPTGMTRFDINSLGVVSTTTPLDRENSSSYSLTVQAIDNGTPPKFNTTTVSVTVIDVNDNDPSFTQDIYYLSVSELTPVGSTVDTAIATDPDLPSNSITYEFSSNTILFAVIPSGAITVGSPLDADVPMPVVNLTVIARDLGSRTSSAIYTITIIDENDNTPLFDAAVYTGTVPENTLNAYVTTVHATDADSTSNSELNYYFEIPSAEFYINSTTGVIRTLIELDRETLNETELKVLAVDNGSPSRTGTTSIQITVLDINDNTPVFSQSIYTASVVENTIDVTVISVTASDPDNGANGTITYSLLNDFQSIFNITQTGDIIITEALDREAISSYTLTVVASDNGSPDKQSSSATVLVNVLDVNDNSPEFIGEPYTASVPENTIGLLLTVNATDMDSNSNGTVNYKLDKYTNLFAIDTVNAQLKAIAGLDFETQCSYMLPVTAFDLGSPSLNVTTIVHINVLPVNDRPPVFSSALYNVQVFEDSSVGTHVVQVNAIDDDSTQCTADGSGSGNIGLLPDPSLMSNITYTLLNHLDVFTINPTSGIITTINSLDREAVPVYILTVSAVDSSNISSNATVYVSIGDINDNEPQFLQSLYSREISENTAIGTSILHILAIDQDTLDSGKLMYELTNAPPFLAIDNRTGIISVAADIDYESISTNYSFFAIVRDTDNHLDAAVINISIVDTNDMPPTINTLPVTLTFTEGQLGIRPFANLSITDPDSFQILSSAVLTLSSPEPTSNCTPNCTETLRLSPFAANGPFPGTISTSIDGRTLTLTGNYSIDIYTTSISTVEYINLISNPLPSDRTVSLIVHDGILYSNILTNAISIIPLNQFPPVIDLNGPTLPGTGYTVTFIEEGVAVGVVATNATITDEDTAVESRVLTGLDVLIFNPQDGEQESIRIKQPYILPQDIVISLNTSHHLTFSGTASIDSYIDVLRQLEYINTAIEPSVVPRVINFTATEYHLMSQVAVTTVVVVTTNDHPPMIMSDPPFNNYAAVYNETGGPVSVVSSNAYISDADSGHDIIIELRVFVIVPALYDRITISPIDNSTGISVSQVSNTELVLTGSSYIENYTSALKNISYWFANDEFTNEETSLRKFITLQVYDDQFSSFSITQISLRPQNDQQPVFSSSLYTVTVPENITIGYHILQLLANDGDTFNASQIRYNITAGNTEDLFNISYTTGLITLAKSLNYEQAMTHTLTVQVQDLLYNTGNATPNMATVEISVGDTNDNVPQFNQTQYNGTIGEGVPLGTSVLQVFASDADSYLHAQLVFALNGNGSDHFSIDSDGIIRTAAAIDRESIAQYSFVATVRNPGSLAHDITQIYIDVIDLDDNSPLLTLSPNIGTLQEPLTVVSLATELSISDPDPLPSLDYATVNISGPGVLFIGTGTLPGGLELTGNNTGTITISGLQMLSVYESVLRNIQYRDFSLEPITLNRTIVYQVSSDQSLSNIATFTVTVSTINDNPPVLLLTTSTNNGSYYTNYIEDSLPIYITDTTLTISDVDTGMDYIEYATVELVTAADGQDEMLSVVLSRGLTLDNGSNSHLLIVRGPGTKEDFRIVLRTIR